jgi:hypothetical protein
MPLHTTMFLYQIKRIEKKFAPSFDSVVLQKKKKFNHVEGGGGVSIYSHTFMALAKYTRNPHGAKGCC